MTRRALPRNVTPANVTPANVSPASVSPASVMLGGPVRQRVTHSIQPEGDLPADDEPSVAGSTPTPPRTPAVARWIIRSQLRAWREAAAMTQGAAAKTLYWSLSKVQRIEHGEVTVSVTDLAALLALYGIEHETEYLVDLARLARRSFEWHEATWCQLDPRTHELVQFEHDAALIGWCESAWVPDPVQTDRYATARLDYLATELPPEQRAAHAAAGKLRRDLFAGSSTVHRPQYQVVLDESVISRPYGGYRVLREQLEALLDQVRSGELQLSIVTYASANPLAACDPFTLIDIDWQPVHGSAVACGDTTVLALHHGPYGPAVTTDPALLDFYRRRWARLWAAYDPNLTELTLLRHLEKINRR